MSIFQKNPFFGSKTDLEVAAEPPTAEPEAPAPLERASVPFDVFAAVELRVGTVRSAEPVTGSEKLLRLSVDFGEAKPRQILSGIAKDVVPEELVGNQFAFVANLPPRSMMGHESDGMLLATDGEEGLVLVGPLKSVPPGSRLH